MAMLTLRGTQCFWKSVYNKHFINFSSITHASPKKVIFNEFGNPTEVLKLVDDDVSELNSELKRDGVLLKVLASPVNPSDINTIQGVYPIKPTSWPATCGREGVMEVLRTGSEVTDFRPGDRVIPATTDVGLWRNFVRLPASSVLSINPDLSIQAAATLVVNPCTAYRLLADFAHLEPGDWVVQNAATSAVGVLVSQMCRQRGIRSCGVIRARESEKETENTKQLLQEFGADLVLTEQELRDHAAIRPVTETGGAKLTLNCVGGKQSLSLFRLMRPGSSLVTYGAMSMSPIPLPASALIFKDISMRGYWMSAWAARSENSRSRRKMIDEISLDLISGRLKLPPIEEVKLEDFDVAIRASQFGGREPRSALPLKQLLVM